MSSRQSYRVEAYNTSKQSENKIHDDTVARRFGFSGGLVPRGGGVGHIMHLPGGKWGRAVLQRGVIGGRVVKTAYDGENPDIPRGGREGRRSAEEANRG